MGSPCCERSLGYIQEEHNNSVTHLCAYEATDFYLHIFVITTSEYICIYHLPGPSHPEFARASFPNLPSQPRSKALPSAAARWGAILGRQRPGSNRLGDAVGQTHCRDDMSPGRMSWVGCDGNLQVARDSACKLSRGCNGSLV